MHRYDLVAYEDGLFKRVQVKYKSVDRTGSFTVHFRACRADNNGTYMRQVNKEGIDLFCSSCPDTDVSYYLHPEEYNVQSP